MSDRFAIPEKDLVRVPASALRAVTEKIFEKMNVPLEDAKRAADVLISADLRGVTSHGVSNMLRKYVRDYQSGKLNPTPNMRTLRESAATMSLDCDRGLGIIVAPKAMERAIGKAKQAGIGMVTIKNSGHMGMVSYYAMQALPHDMLGLAMTSSPPEVVPTFGAEPRLGTNPIALAAPAAALAPFVYDAATSVISSNKIGLAKRLGIPLPGGWVADSEGTPIEGPVAPTLVGYKGREKPSLLPLGSTPHTGSHKGYGLGGVVEILSGILTGGGASWGERSYTHMVAAYDINAFMDPIQFKNDMDEWLRTLIATPPAPGHERVLYPGQLEAESEAECRAHGIPLHTEVVEWFRSTCQEFSISDSL